MQHSRASLLVLVALLGAAGLGALLAGAGQAPPILEGRRLVLRDDQGRPYASIDWSPDSGAMMRLHDDEGRDRIRMAVGPEGTPSLALSDGRARPRVELSILDDQTPRILLRDGKGVERAKLVLMPEGSPVLYLKDAKGTNRVEMTSLWTGFCGMVVFDERERVRCLVGATSEHGSTLHFADRGGVQRLSLGLSAQGAPVVEASDGQGQVTWSPLK